MSEFFLVVRYSARLLIREWRRFVLPLVSLTITGVVIMLMLLLTRGGDALIGEKARELQGGDVVIESSTAIDAARILKDAGIVSERSSYQLDFTASVLHNDTASPASFIVIDASYPLYGTITLTEGVFRPLTPGEVLIDTAGAERLGLAIGDMLTFYDTPYRVQGIVAEEPSSLFGGFRFFPRVFMSMEGFGRAALPLELLRIEYRALFNVPDLTESARANLIAYEEKTGVDIDIAGTSGTGFGRSLAIVSEFLIIAVLITVTLGAANVYSSTLSLIRALRKSFAVLLALGMRTRTLISILGVTLGGVVLLGSASGALLSIGLYSVIQEILIQKYAISLPLVTPFFFAGITLLLISITTVSAFIPAIGRLLHIEPKEMLTSAHDTEYEGVPLRTLLTIAFGSLAPLIVLAGTLLEDLTEGALAIGIIALVYISIALLFTLLLSFLYRIRNRFSFLFRSVISHKKSEGLFGIISFTSLFIALTALGTLALTNVSLTRYLEEDLTRTIPTTYVIDVQPSQKDELLASFPDVSLFQSIPARIITIDGRRIQELLDREDPDTDRELGREYNLTARTELLSSETVVSGKWGRGNVGEISVDSEFATRAGIELGSQMTFLIQGFEVKGTVTSMRDTDSRSGLPFFYFVLSPEDIGQFPGVFFGYAYYEDTAQKDLARFLQPRMPNVSVIETEALAPLIKNIVTTLITLVFLITIPPLLIATLLIATLVVSSYTSRRREGGRLQALGAPLSLVRTHYLVETISLTVLGSILAYLTSVGATAFITMTYLGLGRPVLYAHELVLGLGTIILFVGMIGTYLFMRNRMELRELLAYEANQ